MKVSPEADSESPSVTPNERLAKDIAEKLVAAGLIHSSRVGELERGLSKGTLDAEAWRLLVEISLDRGKP